MVAQRASSLKRGVEILLVLGTDDAMVRDGLGVVQIAQLVGYEKSQVSRALSALAESGLVDRDPETRAYRLGWRLFALAARSGRPRLTALAPAVLARLVSEFGETAHLSVLQGDRVLTLLSEGPSSTIRASGWSGRTVPVTCTSSGRALLFDHDLSALEALLGDASFAGAGRKAPRSVKDLHRRIRAARRDGYALVEEEFEPGLVAAAAPVRDFSSGIIAAVNVSGPEFRLGSRLRAAGEATRLAGAHLSQDAGAT
jgi:IclR family transcriptional regulator, KDG regulon repressor